VKKILFGMLVCLLTAGPAAAEVRIEASPGGRIGDYLNMFMQVRDSGERVVIDGPCLSACTLVLSVVPRDRICITRRAVLGFHAAWHPDRHGRPLTHASATQLMMDTYPPGVRAWIRRKGGLTRRTIILRGRELASMYRRCG
jgi:hypothetical protein